MKIAKDSLQYVTGANLDKISFAYDLMPDRANPNILAGVDVAYLIDAIQALQKLVRRPEYVSDGVYRLRDVSSYIFDNKASKAQLDHVLSMVNSLAADATNNRFIFSGGDYIDSHLDAMTMYGLHDWIISNTLNGESLPTPSGMSSGGSTSQSFASFLPTFSPSSRPPYEDDDFPTKSVDLTDRVMRAVDIMQLLKSLYYLRYVIGGGIYSVKPWTRSSTIYTNGYSTDETNQAMQYISTSSALPTGRTLLGSEYGRRHTGGEYAGTWDYAIGLSSAKTNGTCFEIQNLPKNNEVSFFYRWHYAITMHRYAKLANSSTVRHETRQASFVRWQKATFPNSSSGNGIHPEWADGSTTIKVGMPSLTYDYLPNWIDYTYFTPSRPTKKSDEEYVQSISRTYTINVSGIVPLYRLHRRGYYDGAWRE